MTTATETKRDNPLDPSVIIERIDEYYRSKRFTSATHTNRASELGHPCTRYLVYARTRWEDRAPVSLGLQKIFDEGNLHEKAVVSLLNDIGYEVLIQQKHYYDREHQITGHIDGKLYDSKTRKYRLCEIKTLNPYDHDRINTIDDLGRKYWMAKWVDQLYLYMHLENDSEALLIIKNKVNGDIKVLLVEQNEERVRQLLLKATEINQHIEKDTLPNRLNDSDVCSGCGFKTICQPEVGYSALMPIDNVELESMLERRAEIAGIAKEYKELDEVIKSDIKKSGLDKLLCGRFFVEVKEYERTNYDIPKEIKDQFAKKNTYQRINIQEVGNGK